MNNSLKFGVVSDVQYADQPSDVLPDQRPAQLGQQKLAAAIKDLNEQQLDFVIHLGDLIDRDYHNFDAILQTMSSSKSAVWYALGNHDFCGPEYEYGYKEEALKALGLTDDTRYYYKDLKDWRFIILDTNEVGVIESKQNTKAWDEGQQLIETMKSEGKVNAQIWNGAISNKQKSWLIDTIDDADKLNRKVIVFGHHGIYPEHRENLLNSEDIADLLSKRIAVKAYINGHNHDGNFGVYQGLPCWNIEGMMDYKDKTAYAHVVLSDQELIIHGYGRTQTRIIKIR